MASKTTPVGRTKSGPHVHVSGPPCETRGAIEIFHKIEALPGVTSIQIEGSQEGKRLRKGFKAKVEINRSRSGRSAAVTVTCKEGKQQTLYVRPTSDITVDDLIKTIRDNVVQEGVVRAVVLTEHAA